MRGFGVTVSGGVLAAGLFGAMAEHARAAAPAITPVDFSSCMNFNFIMGQPFGTLTGNTKSPAAKLSFNLVDPNKRNAWQGLAPGNTLTIDLSVQSAKTVYLMMNTLQGKAGIPNATVILKGDGPKANRTIQLIGDKTIRDFNNDGWTNKIGGITRVWWSNKEKPVPEDASHRLDVQTIALGAPFAKTKLTQIQIVAPPQTGNGTMIPAISAIGIAHPGNGPITATCSTK